MAGIENPDIKTKLFPGNPDKENEYGETYLNRRFWARPGLIILHKAS
jgi:hypothetical protein